MYNALRDEVIWLHVKWNLYRQLYGRSSARVELLNRAAAHFFRVLQDVLVEDLVLHIARRLEKPKSNSDRKKLTMGKLPLLVGSSALKADTDTLLQQARARGIHS